jgi:hypothetical protein
LKIWEVAFVVSVLHRACLVRMLRRLMAAAAVSIAVLIQFLADVTYVGFHIL